MDVTAKQQLRTYISDALARHGDYQHFADDESLFVSGRLDSFAMMNLVMQLEQTFGIDFSDIEFDVALVDSLKEMEVLIDSQSKK